MKTSEAIRLALEKIDEGQKDIGELTQACALVSDESILVASILQNQNDALRQLAKAVEQIAR